MKAEAKIQRKEVELSEPQSEVMASRASLIGDIAGQGGGKTRTLGLCVGWMATKFPEAKGFIGANTNEQLSSSTLTNVFQILEEVYGMTEYNAVSNPRGHYVIKQKPPNNKHWAKSVFKFNNYHNIMSFWNGARVFLGSLENYKAHDGKEFAWAHLDETKDTKKEALTDVILGRLRQYGLWVTAEGNVLWAPLIKQDVAERQGLKPWNPCYIHTSPAEGTTEWLIELLGIKPYEKEIKDRITKIDDYFYKKLITVDPNDGKKTETDVIIYSAYHNAEHLPSDYFSKRKARFSAGQILKYIFGYPFGKNGGEYYPGFDRFKHVTKLFFDPKLSIHTAWDFNATPYVTCLCAHVEYITRYWNDKEKKKYDEAGPDRKEMEVLRFRFFKEYTIPDSTTESTVAAFHDDYGSFNPTIYVNGDASGRSRIEGLATLTQYKIIENSCQGKFYLPDGWLRTKKVNIAVAKRRDLMNRIWERKIPQVEVEFDEDMVNTIRDCEYLLKGADGGKHKEKEEDANGIKIEKMGHTSDAAEYLICDLCQDFIKE